MKRIFLGAALFLTCLLVEAQYSITPLKTTHVSIFKNGTYFITKEGEAKPDKGLFVISPPSNALNGSFWLTAGKENRIKSISVKPDVIKIKRSVESIAEFIESSAGKNITIVLPPLSVSGAVREIKGVVTGYTASSGIVRMKTADGRLMICNVAEAQEAYGDAGSGETFMHDSTVRMAKVQLENNPSKVSVSTVSLQTGMAWTPSYFLSLTDDKRAKLDLKATILNTDDEAIKDASVDIVIGNPQLFYGMQLDDIATDFLNRQVLHSEPRPSFTLSYLNNSMTQVQSGAAENEEDAASQMPVYNADGEKTNDLFYFNLGNLTLEGKSKTIVPLQSTDITYDNLYELNVEDQNNYWSTANIVNSTDKVLTTWHVLTIKNNGTSPFTTGPVFVTDQKGRALAQDEMKYTAAGASVKIRLSKAIDINAANPEQVISTSFEKRTIEGYQYTVAKISGKLSVNNYQNKPVTINISKSITGKVLLAEGAEITATPVYSNNKNLVSTMKWVKQIAAKSTTEVTYQYEVLVR